MAGDSGTLAAQRRWSASSPPAIWLDHIGAIAGGTATSSRTGLQAQLRRAPAGSGHPILVEIVIYDLPGRDCAALASNGEIPATDSRADRVRDAVHRPDRLDPAASSSTPTSGSSRSSSRTRCRTWSPTSHDANCAQATRRSTSRASTYALNKLHAIPNVYNYMDIAHSAWLGWPSNMSPAPRRVQQGRQGHHGRLRQHRRVHQRHRELHPDQEPLLTNPTLQVGGQPVDSATFYQYNPTFDELTYDTRCTTRWCPPGSRQHRMLDRHLAQRLGGPSGPPRRSPRDRR